MDRVPYPDLLPKVSVEKAHEEPIHCARRVTGCRTKLRSARVRDSIRSDVIQGKSRPCKCICEICTIAKVQPTLPPEFGEGMVGCIDRGTEKAYGEPQEDKNV